MAGETLLAARKMIDLEEELQRTASDDEKESTVNSIRGLSRFSMESHRSKIDVDIGQLLGSLLGGDVSQENI